MLNPNQECISYPKPVKQEKVKKQWKPGQKKEKVIPEWKKDILSHHRSNQSTKDRAEFPRQVVAELIAEAGGKCQCCFIRPDTSTHHVVPRTAGRGGRGVKNNGLRLCGICHDQIQTNEEQLQYWISEHERKFGEHFWFDEQDWNEFARKQIAEDEAEKAKLTHTAQLEPIVELLTVATGRTLKAKELRLLDKFGASEMAIFARLMQDIIKAGLSESAIEAPFKPEFGYNGQFDD